MSEPTVDPVHGVRYAFEREGDDLLVETWMKPGGGLPEALPPRSRRRSGGSSDGEVRFHLDGEWRTLRPEDGKVRVAPGIVHGLANESGARSAPRLPGCARAGPRGVPDRQRRGRTRGPVHEGRDPEELARREVGGGFLARHEDQTVMTFPPRFAQQHDEAARASRWLSASLAGAMAGEVLTTRELNRTLLGRQLLLERKPLPVPDALEHLVGMQAQNPLDPYFGLWSRLEDFDPKELSGLVESGKAVRAWLMRGTIHLVTARDCLALRPVMDSVMRKTFQGSRLERDTAEVDLDELVEAVEEMLADGPMTRAEIGRALAERWPGAPVESLGLAALYLVPTLQVPPRGTWGAAHRATQAHVERFLGEPMAADDDPGETILRYLRAYGPAAPKDVRAWCYKTGLREVIDRLRPDLVTYRDEDGVELVDVPDGGFADPETPAPPRFLPEYDNALLSHADRSRVIPPGAARVWWKGTVLVDGFVAGTWKLKREKREATLEIGPWERWAKADREAVAEEGERLLAFAAADAEKTALRFERV